MTETKQVSKPVPVVFLTLEEFHDSKNQSKIAHKSISPKYGETDKVKYGLIGYTIGDYTASYKAKLEADKKKKKQSN